MIFNLFGKQRKTAISPFKVDLHSHLIPGIDDGVKTKEESLAIIKRFVSMGVKKIITTPHIMGDFYKNTPENIGEGVKEIQELINEEGIDIQLEAAAEYYLDEYFLKDLKEDAEILCFGNKTLLFELPYINPPIQLDEAVFHMQSRGFKPLLAHPERYPYYHSDIDKLKVLIEKGVQMQLNINSLTGYYSKQVQRQAKKLLKENMIDYIGTDVHNSRHMDVVEKTYKGKWFDRLSDMDFMNDSLL